MARVNFLIQLSRPSRFLNFSLPNWLLYCLAGLVVVAVPLLAFLASDRSRRVVDHARLRVLEQENAVLRHKVTEFDNAVRTLRAELADLASYDTKLRIATSLELIHPDLRGLGTGGRTEDSLTTVLKEHGLGSYTEVSHLDNALQHLLDEARFQKRSFEEIENFLVRQEHLRDHTPSIQPSSGWPMSSFGYRRDPFTGKVAMHEGEDIAAPSGTPIVVAADGYVAFAGPKQGYGLTIDVNHGYGYTTRYAHCQALRASTGDLVRRGDIIGFVGSTGRTTGPHLHYEVEVSGVKVDPMGYIIGEIAVLD